MASTILNANLPSSTVTISATGASGSSGQYLYSTGVGTSPTYSITNGAGTGYSWGNITTTSATPGLQVTGDADIKGKLTVGGKDISKTLEAIEKRLAILTPDPKKLEKFEALQKAYNHYKLMEALCHEDDNDNKK